MAQDRRVALKLAVHLRDTISGSSAAVFQARRRRTAAVVK
jgi:hypothetical protein